MSTPKLMNEPTPLTFREEVWNAVLHGIMVLGLLAMLPWLAVRSYLQGGWLSVLSVSVYLLCLLAMFFNSTLYHSMPYHTPWKKITRRLDHISIALAIAGTYTPVCLFLNTPLSLVLLGVEWLLALVLIALKIFSNRARPLLSNCLYLLMGWMVLFFLPDLWSRLDPGFFFWMLAGGLLYSIGVIFYAVHRPYFHVIWHVMIDLAFACQFIAVVFYLISG